MALDDFLEQEEQISVEKVKRALDYYLDSVSSIQYPFIFFPPLEEGDHDKAGHVPPGGRTQ